MNTMPNKNNKLIVIRGASHMLMLEKPYYHIFQENILEFLNKNNNLYTATKAESHL